MLVKLVGGPKDGGFASIATMTVVDDHEGQPVDDKWHFVWDDPSSTYVLKPSDLPVIYLDFVEGSGPIDNGNGIIFGEEFPWKPQISPPPEE